MTEEKSRKSKVGVGGRGYDKRSGFAIIGDYINNQPIFCSTINQARELFCAIAADKHCLKANVYFRDHEKDTFLNLVQAGKYRQAMEFWNELVCEDELRIIKGTMIVPAYRPPATTTGGSSSSSTGGGNRPAPSASPSSSAPSASKSTTTTSNSELITRPPVIDHGYVDGFRRLSMPEPRPVTGTVVNFPVRETQS